MVLMGKCFWILGRKTLEYMELVEFFHQGFSSLFSNFFKTGFKTIFFYWDCQEMLIWRNVALRSGIHVQL
jgi:hypothetical protein